MPHNCLHVFAPGGRSELAPCGSSGVCGPGDVSAWQAAALGWVELMEKTAATSGQRHEAAVYRDYYTRLSLGITIDWQAKVAAYMKLCQDIHCRMFTVDWGKAPRPIPPPTDNGGDDNGGGDNGGGDNGGGDNGGEEETTEEDDDSWFDWIPDLPDIPWPSLPGLPSLPSIPTWAWFVAGGLLLWWLWPEDERRRRW